MDLYEAVFYGNVEACERLIKEGENINVEIGSITPIRLALLFDHKNVADLLIKNGADIKFGKNLFELISCQNYPVAKILIKNGFNMDEEDIYGRTILLHLLWCNDINMIKFLIKNGANINNIDKYGSSIFHGMVQNKSQDIEWLVLLSLKYGADINAKDMYGETPLHIAVCDRKIEMINLLIKNGANPRIVDNDGNLPLHSLFRKSFQNYKSWATFDILFPYCGDINAVNSAGNTFLHISDKSIKVMDFLLNKGANPNIINNIGETVLHTCLDFDNEIMEFLLNRGANPNIIINGENTILYTMFDGSRYYINNTSEKIKLLLKYGANPNLIDKNNETLFIKIVRENCKLGAFFGIDLLLPYVTDYDVVDTYGHSALYYFIKSGYREQTETILKLRKIKKKKTILLMITAHEFDEGSLLHRDYLCRDLFKILIDFL